ncbi:hypothetical protein KCA24_34550, partial [Escherichia coli]|nr:hypothetical protein [Escherichia coli]
GQENSTTPKGPAKDPWGGGRLFGNPMTPGARQARQKLADAESVERDSSQNYGQGSFGFHVWPPDQPPLVRLNARILYH